MAGLYLHIPFCKSKCAYCDFFSVATLNQKEDFIKALIGELKLQKEYLVNESIDSIYFGGGTPSVLVIKELDLILNEICKNYTVNPKAEITLEANPDDLDINYLKNLRNSGVNRLSIGVQSFIDNHLTRMKRRHNAQKAKETIQWAQNCGFNNISADLIYGLPQMPLSEWNYNLETLMSFNVQHISAYHLTIEPNTLFNKWVKQKSINLPSDSESTKQLKLLIKETKKKGFVHYEISNFALDGFFSKHNSSYWINEKYLGVGPSAHSYNLTSRQWNISNVQRYIAAISQGNIPFEKENLTLNDKYNDYILTSLRTMWGINLQKIEIEFGKLYFDYFMKSINSFLESKHLKKTQNKVCLTPKGIFISDLIIRALLKV